jgi:hypothetical protein
VKLSKLLTGSLRARATRRVLAVCAIDLESVRANKLVLAVVLAVCDEVRSGLSGPKWHSTKAGVIRTADVGAPALLVAAAATRAVVVTSVARVVCDTCSVSKAERKIKCYLRTRVCCDERDRDDRVTQRGHRKEKEG